MEIVRKPARQHGVPVLSESGSTDHGHTLLARPEYFEEVLRSYPDVTVQLAHLGQAGQAEVAHLNAAYGNVHTDTAMRLGGPAIGDLDPGELVDLIPDRRRPGHVRHHLPILARVEYEAALRALPVTEDELRLVGHEDAESVWGVR
jgi:hypothetical protein